MRKHKQHWELKYDQEIRTLNLSLKGLFQKHSIMFFHKTVCESIVEMDVKKLLVNMYDIHFDYDLETIDLSQIPKLYQSYSVSTKLCVAIITARESTYLSTFLKFEQICNEYSYNVKIFENKTAANIWLKSFVELDC